jgi:hypothetical protein
MKNRRKKQRNSRAANESMSLDFNSKPLPPALLLRDIRLLIEHARGRAAAAVNAEMVTLYWSIGERIRKDSRKGPHTESRLSPH